MSDTTYGQRPKTSRASRRSGLILVAVSSILAVMVAVGLGTWSNDPGSPSRLISELLGGPSMSVDNPGSGTWTSATPQNTPSVPRSRTGLVATAQNRGQVLFGRYCDSCHTWGREMIGPSLSSAEFKSEFTTPEQIAKVVRDGGFDMPAFPASMVSDDEIQSIAEYILSLPQESQSP